MTIEDELATLLRHPDEGGLRTLLERRPEELDELLELNLDDLLPEQPSCEQVEWASRVMQEVFARVDEAAGPARPELTDDPREREAREIGEVFADRLVPAVDDTDYSLWSFFTTLDEVPEPRWWTDLDDLSIETAGEAGRFLHRFGMSPLTVAVAAHGIANDLRRAYDLRRLPREAALTVTAVRRVRPRWERADLRADIVSVADLGRQVSFVTGLDASYGLRLGEWLFRVAHHRPRLFDGFVCKGEGEPLLCHPVSEVESLRERWSSS